MTGTTGFGANAALMGRRKSRRACVDLPGNVELVTGFAKVRVVSLSASGASLAFAEEPPKAGAELVLTFERFECFGRVVWRRGDRAGIAFYDPLREEEVVEARHASDTLHEREARRIQSIARAWVQGRPAATGGPGAEADDGPPRL
jgi:hypothetical protein